MGGARRLLMGSIRPIHLPPFGAAPFSWGQHTIHTFRTQVFRRRLEDQR